MSHKQEHKNSNACLPAFQTQVSSLLLLAGIFFTNFLSRIILAPLLITIEEEMSLGHGEAGGLFILISLGVCFGLLVSGFVSSRLNHRTTIVASSWILGASLIAISLSHTLPGMRICLVFLGLAAGLYFPSGIAALTALVRPNDWGKALAIHELAPNLGFVVAPLLAEALCGVFSWRSILVLLGIVAFLMNIVFIRFGRGGEFPGEAPRLRNLRLLLSRPSFWVMVVLFGLAIGASLGVYTVIPLYLVAERQMDRALANTLVALSRVSGIGMALMAGWFADRLGVKHSIGIFSAATGLLTVLLGWVPSQWLIPVVFLQALAAVCFFPAGFAAISRMVPSSQRNIAISFSVPVAVFVGAGIIPAFLGFLGERGSFPLGFSLMGGSMMFSVGLLAFLRFTKEETT